jgi:hypothetical protein
VPVAPLLDTLVQVHEALAELRVAGVVAVDADQQLLQARRGLDGRGRIAIELIGRHLVPLAGQVAEERVPQRGLGPAPLQRRTAGALRRARNGPAVLDPQLELELAELVRLETAPLLEPLAKGHELERRHRLEDVELRDQHLQDREHPLEGVLHARQVARREEALDVVDLVQDLLEPELVDLVDDDEQHLVVFGPVGARTLEVQQLRDAEVGGVVDGLGRGHGVASPRWPRRSSSHAFMVASWPMMKREAKRKTGL